MNGDPAYGILLSDLIEGILLEADSPALAAAFIARELASMVGVRSVHVASCPAAHGGDEHRLLASYPERRRAEAGPEIIAEAARLAHGGASSILLDSGKETPLGRALAGPERAVVTPLAVSGRPMGFILMLGLEDCRNIKGLFKTLDRLSGVLALVIRNARAHEELEGLVAARTAELTARNLELEAALREKDILVQEVHHRVKNNMQIIVSLLSLQSARSAFEETKEALAACRSRVHSMALVHERIYHSADLASVSMGSYLRELTGSLSASLGEDFDIELSCDDSSLGITQAVPCGLVANELITNCAKHAKSPGARAKVHIDFKAEGEMASLSVSDEGPGLPADFEERARSSLGMSIVRSLAAQLGGALSVDPGGEGRGAAFSLRFNRNSPPAP
jgi:two-component sensor histidine kinase